MNTSHPMESFCILRFNIYNTTYEQHISNADAAFPCIAQCDVCSISPSSLIQLIFRRALIALSLTLFCIYSSSSSSSLASWTYVAQKHCTFHVIYLRTRLIRYTSDRNEEKTGNVLNNKVIPSSETRPSRPTNAKILGAQQICVMHLNINMLCCY